MKTPQGMNHRGSEVSRAGPEGRPWASHRQVPHREALRVLEDDNRGIMGRGDHNPGNNTSELSRINKDINPQTENARVPRWKIK